MTDSLINTIDIYALDQILDASGSKITLHDFGGGINAIPVMDPNRSGPSHYLLSTTRIAFDYIASDGKLLHKVLDISFLTDGKSRGLLQVSLSEILATLEQFAKGVEGYEAGLRLVAL